jgi:adenylate cyclase class IV
MDTKTLTACGMVEKKTIINLLEAYGVAVKHYLRGEDRIYYHAGTRGFSRSKKYFRVKNCTAYAMAYN